MMNDAEPVPGRVALHSRQISFQSFARPDGLWDVEGSLRDVKEVRIERPSLPPLMPGDTVHDMHVRVTVDDDLRIVAIAARLAAAPFDECQMTRDAVQRLVGRQLGRGWHGALQEVMGGVQGCTHLRELLQALATAAIQGISVYRDQRRRDSAPWGDITVVPHFVGGCMSWRQDGPVVRRLLPQFAAPSISTPPESTEE
ncbi:Protein of unknown function [Variovorax sp. HW608]|uniref:DUF2889 domain-containing protein n=1 Tax=Variovorax sp. HW608 TaxID=1034889 RepID=UPI00081FF7D2|nr:DUF2889 domain-containing protein [Variovorax sp. HW608]SCK10470.1 Protein of unknown function [Variovorax sp. HW608]